MFLCSNRDFKSTFPLFFFQSADLQSETATISEDVATATITEDVDDIESIVPSVGQMMDMFGLTPLPTTDKQQQMPPRAKSSQKINITQSSTSKSIAELSQALNQPTGTQFFDELDDDDKDEDDDPIPAGQQLPDEQPVANVEAPPIVFLLTKTFANMVEFENFLDKDKWKRSRRETLNKGIKTYYRCGATKRRGRQCAAGAYTLHDFEPNNTQVRWYEKNQLHDHENHENLRTTVPEAVKTEILDLKAKGNTPKAILFKLQKRTDIEVPSKSQIENVIDVQKKKNVGLATTTMNDLLEFYENNKNIPEDDDTAFVANFERSERGSKEKWFRFYMTTKRLLKNAKNGKIIHADGTYKVTIQNYNLLVVGTTDAKQSFHLAGLTISTHERAEDYRFVFNTLKDVMQKVTEITIIPRALVADAAPAIHKGFLESLGIFIVIMCWFHVTLNVRKQKFNSSQNCDLILDDLRAVHYLYTPELFAIGMKLFNGKWMTAEAQFVRYFNSSFVERNTNWFHGVAHRVPKTNNALESFNGSLKKHQTFWLQKNLSEFKHRALEIVSERSYEYVRKKDPKAPFTEHVPVIEGTKARGLKLARSSNEFQYEIVDEGYVNYYCFSEQLKKPIITFEDLANFKAMDWSAFTDFDKFIEAANSIRMITFSQDPKEWTNARCTCQSYMDDFMCKHILAIAFRLKIIQPVETDEDDVPLKPNKKRGRPKKVPKGLAKST